MQKMRTPLTVEILLIEVMSVSAKECFLESLNFAVFFLSIEAL